MDIASAQTPLLIGALLFACSALLQVHIVQRVAGSSIVPAQWASGERGELIALPDRPTEKVVIQEGKASGQALGAGRQPKARRSPSVWSEQDAKVRQVVAMTTITGPAYRGDPACTCGGAWRYRLCRGSDELWRCLHCGGLHSGQELVPED